MVPCPDDCVCPREYYPLCHRRHHHHQVAKNKIAPPFRVVEMDILFGTGIDTVSCLLDAAEDAGIFTRKGSWYSYEGKNVAQVVRRVPLFFIVSTSVRGLSADSANRFMISGKLK